MDKNFIGERISELRLKKNVSEYQMSLDLGKNKSYIQSLTSGRSLPTMQSFLDICDYLEVTPQQFFDSELHNLPLIDKATLEYHNIPKDMLFHQVLSKQNLSPDLQKPLIEPH